MFWIPDEDEIEDEPFFDDEDTEELIPLPLDVALRLRAGVMRAIDLIEHEKRYAFAPLFDGWYSRKPKG